MWGECTTFQVPTRFLVRGSFWYSLTLCSNNENYDFFYKWMLLFPVHPCTWRSVQKCALWNWRKESRISVQIGLLPSLNRESLSWGRQLSWPLANTNPSVAFQSHLESSSSRLEVEAAAANTEEHLCGPTCRLTALFLIIILLMFGAEGWRVGRERRDVLLTQFFPPFLQALRGR